MSRNFAMTGVAGFVAPRHLKAIHDTGNRLVAAFDPHDAVGVLDRYSYDVRFFTEFERFDRHIEKLRRGPAESRLHFLTVCSPNYLHDAHVRLALRADCDVICEKPLVINPWNLDALQELERETGRRVYTVLQLRHHPVLRELQAKLAAEAPGARHEVDLTYVTPRGRWYNSSWKGSEERSGGLAVNIGIHFFDMLVWLFGPVKESSVTSRTPTQVAGHLQLERAAVRWFLSSDPADVPATQRGELKAYRCITVDGEEVHFTDGFTDLHTRVYESVLAGGGHGIDDARPSIELAYRIRHQPLAL